MRRHDVGDEAGQDTAEQGGANHDQPHDGGIHIQVFSQTAAYPAELAVTDGPGESFWGTGDGGFAWQKFAAVFTFNRKIVSKSRQASSEI